MTDEKISLAELGKKAIGFDRADMRDYVKKENEEFFY